METFMREVKEETGFEQITPCVSVVVAFFKNQKIT